MVNSVQRALVRIYLLGALSLLFWAVPASGHHSFTAEFDATKPVTISGTITKLEWINPHVYMFVDVKDADGKITNWQISSNGPSNCHYAGMTKEDVAPGKVVKIQAYRAKDGTKNLAYLRNIWFQDGREVEMWVGDRNIPDQAK